ncbi:hypothetical protein ACQKO6_20200 [Pseudomonas monteilii]
MPARFSSPSSQPSPLGLRLIAGALGLGMLAVGAASAYWLVVDVLPLFGRIYRHAPIVETPYLGFFLLAPLAITPLIVVACASALWRGEKFDPPRGSRLFRFQVQSLQATLRSMLYVSPALAVLTTAILLARDYSPCSKLLISGSAWQLFWVNDDRLCFKPDFYIEDHWPCKRVDGKDVCIQVDGRS